MPGGFENSAMKSSFSLSSLQPSSTSLETPEHARPERPYNSLRKTCRKNPEKEAWRRSWDRKDDNKDEFWNALEPNYLYLMDSNLIDSCKEAGRDLHYVTSPSHDWSFEQFCSQFTELDLWLTSIQETIYSKEENVTDRNLRLTHVEEMHRKTYKRKVFNNQGGRLAARFPELKEEVKWRMTHLNRKWERLEQTVTPRKRTHPDNLLIHAIDVEHELNCLRKWLRLTERRLLPINFHTSLALSELEVKAKEHQVIQREVELHGKIVCSVLKRCDRLAQAETEAGVDSPVNLPSRNRRFDSNQALRYARDLERRWQHLYLRSLEWLCHIDNLIRRAKDRSPVSAVSLDSDEGEPVLKHPRLSTSPWPDHQDHHAQDVDEEYLMDVSTCSTNDMVGPQSELNHSLATSYTPASCKSPPSPSILNRSGSMQISSEEDVLNENYPFNNDVHTRRQSMPVDTARKLFSDETSVFTKSDRPAPNHGTFYFKHHDTESEQDGQMDQSSEEEWTYKCGTVGGDDSPAQNDDGSLCQSTETLASAPKSVKHEPVINTKLQKLIKGAEVIAAEVIAHSSPTHKARDFPPLIFESTKSRLKVNDWMMRKDWNPEDGKTQGESCDASGEYTTEEEERHSSGDFNTSVIPCHHSTEVLPAFDSPVVEKPPLSAVIASTPEHLKMSPVVLRAKRKEGTPKRPLSESGLPQQLLGEDKLLQSRSESALNQMDHTPTQSVKMDTSVHGTLSSSTTVEEMPNQMQEGSGGGYSSNSLNRRRKIKLKKRNVGRRSDSGSDGHDPPSPLKSAPVNRRLSTSGTETEEELDGECKLRAGRKKQTAQPMFKLGPSGGAVTVFHCADKTLSAESSFSEQAWDNYQEKYMSEAYSEEIPDQETIRKVLDFGDDYRNHFDSQSDGASSLGMSRPTVFTRRRRPVALDRESSALDSDSEVPEFRSLIAKSLSSLFIFEQEWTQISKESPHLVMAKNFAEIKLTCKEHARRLKFFLDKVEMTNDFIEESREIRGLIGRWESLEVKTEELQKMRSLQREMAALREEMVELTKRVSSMDHDNLQDKKQLELKIQQIKGEQANLRERKSQLIEVNSAVHKFFTDSGQQDGGQEIATRLKEDVKELYFVWDETNKRVCQQLDRLTQLLTAWQTFESHLSELQLALRGDHNTLRMLDSALQTGPVSQDVASSVIDVAKVLSEKQDLCFSSVSALNNTTPVILSLPGSTEGSLSDSGISDSGSEQESERERRLSALRRLARQLESVLSPNSQAILDMARRIEQTENELRGLQKTCRELIVRTACADARIQRQDSPTPSQSLPPPPALANRSKKNLGALPQNFMDLDPDDDDPDPKGSAGWLWRVIRAALPFQMAILALFCVACLLEPHCCDSMNNLNFSLTPQLRYVRGPPPV